MGRPRKITPATERERLENAFYDATIADQSRMLDTFNLLHRLKLRNQTAVIIPTPPDEIENMLRRSVAMLHDDGGEAA